MNKAFSTKWISSTKPRKQRKYRARAPLHIKQKFMGSHLSKALREKHKTRSLPVRSGDKVKIMRGQFKGIEAKVDHISRIKERIYVIGAEVEKKNGTKIMYPIHPSNVVITELAQDARRLTTAAASAIKSAKKT